MIPLIPYYFFSYFLAAALICLIVTMYWPSGRKAKMLKLHPKWGSVYLVQDSETPYLYKIGWTTRRVFTRGKEISRDMAGGAAIKSMFIISLPYARDVETLVHARLRQYRYFSERGNEWYYARTEEEAKIFIKEIKRTADYIRAVAIKRRRWGKFTDDYCRAFLYEEKGPMKRAKLFSK